MIPAGAELGVPAAKTAMAIAGLGARDIMGFCVINLLYAGAVIGLWFPFYLNLKYVKKLVLC